MLIKLAISVFQPCQQQMHNLIFQSDSPAVRLRNENQSQHCDVESNGALNSPFRPNRSKIWIASYCFKVMLPTSVHKQATLPAAISVVAHRLPNKLAKHVVLLSIFTRPIAVLFSTWLAEKMYIGLPAPTQQHVVSLQTNDKRSKDATKNDVINKMQRGKSGTQCICRTPYFVWGGFLYWP